MKKLLIPITILIIIILILGLILALSNNRQKDIADRWSEAEPIGSSEPVGSSEPEESTEQIIIQEFDDSFLNIDAETVAPSSQEADRAEVKLLARNFLEDYGSFSTIGGYDHIEDLYDQMTDFFRKQVKDWLSRDPARQKSSDYYSIETIVSDVRIDQFASSKVKAIVDVKRTETDAPEYYNQTSKQEVEIEVVRVGGEWRVDSVYWK